jgi:predicted NAD/FAD-dependent oxidoreductase
LSGLAAGTLLRQNGFEVRLLDKGKAAGGRMASRRLRDEQGVVGVCDYGAQHFAVLDSRFRSRVEEWISQGFVREWCSHFPGEAATDAANIHYMGVPSMREIAVRLAHGLTLHVSARVTGFDWSEGAWLVATDTGGSYSADVLILTPPVPQIKTLLQDSAIRISPDDQRSLDNIQYDPCIAMLAILAGSSSIPQPGGLLVPEGPIKWIADNSKKGVSPTTPTVTILGHSEFSAEHLESEDETIAANMLDAARPLIGADVALFQIHRWRYSQPRTMHNNPFLWLEEPGPLVLAGDAFVAPSLEGAFLSGHRAAQEIQSRWPVH